MQIENPNVIDFTFLDSMLRLAKGNPRFVTEVVNRFLKQCPLDVENIMKFKSDHDREALKHKTHKFVSSCSVVGAMRVIELSQILSRKSDPETEAVVLEWLDILNKEVNQVYKTLQDYLLQLKSKAS